MNTVNLEYAQETETDNRQIRLATFWTILGTLGAVAVLPYQLTINPSAPPEVPIPLPVLLAGQIVQTCLTLLLFNWLGLRMGRRIGLDSPLARALVYGRKRPAVPRRVVLFALITGVVCGAVIIPLDLLFRRFMPPITLPDGGSIALWKRLLAVPYGGITEELMVRLFVMTLIAWLLWKIVCKAQRPPTAAIFWTSIVLAAILFGVGHLPAMAKICPLTPMVVLRTISLNALAGIAFGFLYWRWGLEYAMLAHFSADIVLHVIGGT